MALCRLRRGTYITHYYITHVSYFDKLRRPGCHEHDFRILRLSLAALVALVAGASQGSGAWAAPAGGTYSPLVARRGGLVFVLVVALASYYLPAVLRDCAPQPYGALGNITPASPAHLGIRRGRLHQERSLVPGKAAQTDRSQSTTPTVVQTSRPSARVTRGRSVIEV